MKYVLLTLRADNNGEGGIFSLFALVRKESKYLIIPAMIGGSALLADGMLTPAVTVTSAVEGLRLIPSLNNFFHSNENNILIIVICILAVLFFIQYLGTNFVGKLFSPIMLVWFSSLAFFGLINLNKICFVAGLGGKANCHGKRDGSFSYYISEPIVCNEPKGLGPFILAASEANLL